jgi:hypothetical protein
MLRAERVTIDRVLKRDVVLSNGERFRLDRMEKQVGGTWGTTLYLVRPDDPRVAKTRRQITRNRLRTAAIRNFEDWRRDALDPSEVAAAFTALAEYEASRIRPAGPEEGDRG